MEIRISSSATGSRLPFQPLDPPVVRLASPVGPIFSETGFLPAMRRKLVADWIASCLRYLGYEVIHSNFESAADPFPPRESPDPLGRPIDLLLLGEDPRSGAAPPGIAWARQVLICGSIEAGPADAFPETREEFSREWTDPAIRLALLRAHHSQGLVMDRDRLEEGRKAWRRLQTASGHVHSWLREPLAGSDLAPGLTTAAGLDLEDAAAKAVRAFSAAIAQDFQADGALAVLFELVRALNLYGADRPAPRMELSILRSAAEILTGGLEVLGLPVNATEKSEIPENVRHMARERDEARSRRDYQAADELRDRIQQEGYQLEDTPSGSLLRKSDD